jgi:hypothetical protein
MSLEALTSAVKRHAKVRYVGSGIGGVMNYAMGARSMKQARVEAAAAANAVEALGFRAVVAETKSGDGKPMVVVRVSRMKANPESWYEVGAYGTKEWWLGDIVHVYYSKSRGNYVLMHGDSNRGSFETLGAAKAAGERLRLNPNRGLTKSAYRAAEREHRSRFGAMMRERGASQAKITEALTQPYSGFVELHPATRTQHKMVSIAHAGRARRHMVGKVGGPRHFWREEHERYMQAAQGARSLPLPNPSKSVWWAEPLTGRAGRKKEGPFPSAAAAKAWLLENRGERGPWSKLHRAMKNDGTYHGYYVGDDWAVDSTGPEWRF